MSKFYSERLERHKALKRAQRIETLKATAIAILGTVLGYFTLVLYLV